MEKIDKFIQPITVAVAIGLGLIWVLAKLCLFFVSWMN